jgi:hypothetical protein
VETPAPALPPYFSLKNARWLRPEGRNGRPVTILDRDRVTLVVTGLALSSTVTDGRTGLPYELLEVEVDGAYVQRVERPPSKQQRGKRP